MALTFDQAPLQDSTWQQRQSAQSTHTKRIRVTGFTTSTYYAMLNELYNDPGLPAIGSPVDALFQLTLLRGWSVVTVQCGSPVPEIIMEMDYSEQSIFTSTVADSNGPVVFRQRSLAADERYYVDRSGAYFGVTYKGTTENEGWVGQRSLMLYDCERYENDNPEPRVRPLLSTVNNATWNSRPARSVLFSDFSSDTRDEGETYLCIYTFVYDPGPNGHDPTLFYRNDDGRIPVDIGPEGIITPEVYPQTNFGTLNISLP